MFFKVPILLLTPLLSLEAGADGMIVVRPHEINSLCHDSDLAVTISPLTHATRSRTHLVKANPCFSSTMRICSAIYREVMIETIMVKVKALELSNRVEVPGTQRDRLVQWDSQYCPPFRPDCDL